MESTWTITELAERAVAVLAADPAVKLNGRVRDLPNERLVRWYTTIGLVDPPHARRGRTALYGERHLLQIVAVKRRQAAGRTIAEIQAELAGATDDTLRGVARLPAPAAPDPGPAPGPRERRRDRFWALTAAAPETPDAPMNESAAAMDDEVGAAMNESGAAMDESGAALDESGAAPRSDDLAQRSADAATGSAGAVTGSVGAVGATPGSVGAVTAGAGAVAAVSEAAGARRMEAAGAGPSEVRGVRLAPGVLLVLDSPEAPSAEDLAAIGQAADPLVTELRRRGLLPTRPPPLHGTTTDHDAVPPAAQSDEKPGRST